MAEEDCVWGAGRNAGIDWSTDYADLRRFKGKKRVHELHEMKRKKNQMTDVRAVFFVKWLFLNFLSSITSNVYALPII